MIFPFHRIALLPILLLTLYLYFIPQALAIELTLKEKEFIVNHDTIRVHNETNWPPFNFYENGVAQGISIDVMDRIAELTGLRVDYVTGPSWDEFTKMIQKDQLDVMLNIIDLPERQSHFQFTSPYVKSLTGVFTSTENRNLYNSFDDLANKTIAVPAGFDLEISMPQYHPEIELLPVRDILECIEAVHSGKADAFMEEIGVVDYIVSQRVMSTIQLSFQVHEEPFLSNLTIGTNRNNPLLHSIIQKGLNSISGDELNLIRKKWLLKVHEIYERSMVNLSVAEKEYLYDNNQVTICVDPSWPPLDFINKSGEHDGLSADLINIIAQRLDVTLTLIPTTTWEHTLSTIKEGDCDIIPLMNETQETQSYLDFTRPYFDFATVIATRKDASFIGDYSELYGKKVALQAYFFITEYVRRNHPQIEIVEVENTSEALKMVSEGNVYATIDGLPTIVNTIEVQALENIKIVGTVPQKNSMKLGVRKDKPMLYTILDIGVASLTEQEKIGLYKKWLDIDLDQHFINRSTVLRIALAFSLLLAFLLWRQLALGRYAKKLQVLNDKLHHYSTVDHLTQVLNRRAIEKRLQSEIERTQITGAPLALVLFDIDHFKSINDTYGHPTGDKVLKKISTHVEGSIRHSDHLGRWGGEEFLIVLPNTALEGGEKMLENLRKSIETYDFGLERKVTVSFGLGQYGIGESMTAFISRVDNSLYKAKEKGRNMIISAEEPASQCVDKM
ncbi:transporter substrate-binding domain-containing protein [Desulfopila sp. IMCC35008]|uniref:transporter substrate-binding domain-containing diguanylate cyclase n=1 Tax=Desulfopila sp. IMCC35008 TaxID=2653858 RepID=UPI0013D70243|nr:transporter substrate-binding domain-containing protein [Desulfopila sp. IMCC35008]